MHTQHLLLFLRKLLPPLLSFPFPLFLSGFYLIHQRFLVFFLSYLFLVRFLHNLFCSIFSAFIVLSDLLMISATSCMFFPSYKSSIASNLSLIAESFSFLYFSSSSSFVRCFMTLGFPGMKILISGINKF